MGLRQIGQERRAHLRHQPVGLRAGAGIVQPGGKLLCCRTVDGFRLVHRSSHIRLAEGKVDAGQAGFKSISLKRACLAHGHDRQGIACEPVPEPVCFARGLRPQRSTRHGTTGTPSAWSNRFATSLSICSAEPSTRQPT